MVKLSAAFFHDESSITIEGYENSADKVIIKGIYNIIGTGYTITIINGEYGTYTSDASYSF